MSTITHDFDNVPKKKHYSAKLKERIAELERDLYKVIDGDVETITIYKARRQFKKDKENVMWFGNSTYGGVQLGGIINKIKDEKNK